MSIRKMTEVWEYSTHRGSHLLMMLAIADNYNDKRGCAFPGYDYLAKKCKCSRRQAIRLIQDLEKSGELIVDRTGYFNTYDFKLSTSDIDVTSPQQTGDTGDQDGDILGESGDMGVTRTFKPIKPLNDLISIQDSEVVHLWEKIKSILKDEIYLTDTGAWNQYIETVTPILIWDDELYLAVPPDHIDLMNQRYKKSLDRKLIGGLGVKFISDQVPLEKDPVL